MKHLFIIFVISLIYSLQTGCASSAHGTIVGSSKTKEEALLFDIVTSPIQAAVFAPAYIAHKIEQNKDNSEKREEEQYRHLLLTDPSIIASGDWPYDDSSKSKPLRGMLWRAEGNFTGRDLTLLVERNSKWKDPVYSHPNCPQKLLMDGFRSYENQAKRTPLSSSFRKILNHPNTPLSTVKEVSHWKDLSESDEYYVNRILKAKTVN